MGNFDRAMRAPFAKLHVGESVCANVALDESQPAPPIIVWRDPTNDECRVFRQVSRSSEAWRYDVVDALWVES